MVYAISQQGKPLVPTKRHGKVRRLLKQGLAKVVKREPFTIQLLYDTTTYVQPVTVGIDIGSKTVGVSAITDKKEVFSAKVVLRTDIKRLIVRKKRIQTVKKVSQDEVQKSKIFE